MGRPITRAAAKKRGQRARKVAALNNAQATMADCIVRARVIQVSRCVSVQDCFVANWSCNVKNIIVLGAGLIGALHAKSV